MKIAIVGSREWPYPKQIEDWISANILGRFEVPTRRFPRFKAILTGGARGVDYIAESYAKQVGLRVIIHRADWKNLGRKAGVVRNAQVVDEADYVVIFWDGMSPGTKNVINHCHAMMVPYEVHYPNKPGRSE